jgi:ABC-type transport system involved in cytochrome bd biosynthesis fused ATPase/permease subunit
MKTAFNSSNKDNVAIATLIAAGFIVAASGLFSSNAAVASQAVAVQRLDAIVVTASRAPDVRLDTIVVTASRKIDRA